MSIMEALNPMYPGDAAAAHLGVVALGVGLLSTAAVAAARVRWLARRPAPRHAALLSALVAGLAMPALAWAFAAIGRSAITIPVLEPASGRPPAMIGEPFAAPSPPVAVAPLPLAPTIPGADPRATEPRAEAGSPLRATVAVLAGLWGVGTLMLLVGLTRGVLKAHALRSSARPTEDPAILRIAEDVAHSMGGRRRVPTVLISSSLATPVVVGVVRPAVILPEGLAGSISAEELRDVLLHELAHARRRDPLVVLLQGIARALYWPIAPVHVLNRELERAREELCDNHVLQDRDALSYGETLLHLAELATGRDAGPLAPAVAAGILHWRGKLESRIAGLLDAGRSTATRTPRALACGLLALFLGTGSLAASMRFVARAEGLESEPPAPAPAKPAGRSILVKAVDPDGKPMAGVTIEANVVAEPAYRGDRRFATDGRGEVRLALPGGISDLELRARADHCVPMLAGWGGIDRPTTLLVYRGSVTGMFVASAPGTVGGKVSGPLTFDGPREVKRPPEALPAEFTFRMARGFAIGGTVRDPDGRPIEGAKVQVQIINSQTLWRQTQPDPQLATGEHTPHTDANGRWSLDNVPMVLGFGLMVVASHPDYAAGEIRDGFVEAPIRSLKALRGHTDTITLRPALTVRGAVSDPDGKPVPGAMVVSGGLRLDTLNDIQAVRADDQGRFELRRQAIGKGTLTIVGEGWMPASRRVEIGPGRPPLDIRLDPGRDLRIRFVDIAGKPIPGVSVVVGYWHGGDTLYGNHQPDSPESKIPFRGDHEGRYRWSWAPDGPVEYVAFKQGYSGSSVTLTADGEEHTVVLREEPAGKVK